MTQVVQSWSTPMHFDPVGSSVNGAFRFELAGISTQDPDNNPAVVLFLNLARLDSDPYTSTTPEVQPTVVSAGGVAGLLYDSVRSDGVGGYWHQVVAVIPLRTAPVDNVLEVQWLAAYERFIGLYGHAFIVTGFSPDVTDFAGMSLVEANTPANGSGLVTLPPIDGTISGIFVTVASSIQDQGYGMDLVSPSGYTETTPDYIPATILLLHANEGANATSTVDETGRHNVMTFNGGMKLGATNKFGGSALSFDGVNDSIDFPASSDYTMTGDFTVEGWFRFNTVTGIPHPWQIGLDAFNRVHIRLLSGTMRLYRNLAGVELQVDTGFAPNTNVWYHIAVVKTSGTLKAYVDGVLVGTLSGLTFFGGTPQLTLGTQRYSPLGVDWFNGSIDEFRIAREAVYTANFDPPDSPFVLDHPNTIGAYRAIITPAETDTITWDTGLGSTVEDVPAVAFFLPPLGARAILLRSVGLDERVFGGYFGGRLRGTTVSCAGDNANKVKPCC